MIASCLNCQKEFLVQPYQLERGGGKYCSKICFTQHRRRRVQITCDGCQEPFITFPCKVGRKKYCSRKCQNESTRKRVQMVCQCCGSIFFARAAMVRFRGQEIKYCSKACAGKAKVKLISFCCKVCGKNVSFPTREAHSGTRVHCSDECYKKSRVERFSGDKNPNWTGGVRESYPDTFNAKFKKRIRQRDNYTCAICGSYGMDVHHIDSNKQNTTDNNCITLCFSCHPRMRHNRKFWEAFLSVIIETRCPKFLLQQ